MTTKKTEKREPTAAEHRQLLRKAGTTHVISGYGLILGSYFLVTFGMSRDFETPSANYIGGVSIMLLSSAVLWQGFKTRRQGVEMLRKAGGDSGQDGLFG